MVRGIVLNTERANQFKHLPVPKERDDNAYFEPLKELKLPEETDLYLGLVHYDDEVGDKCRLSKAQEYVHVDGIGSECGWGRGDPERVPSLLNSHAKLIENF